MFIAAKGRRYDEHCFRNADTFSDISDGLGEYNVITIKEWIENKINLHTKAVKMIKFYPLFSLITLAQAHRKHYQDPENQENKSGNQ